MANLIDCTIDLTKRSQAVKSKHYEKQLAKMDRGIEVLAAHLKRTQKFANADDHAVTVEAVKQLMEDRGVKRKQLLLSMQKETEAFANAGTHRDGDGAGVMSLLVRAMREGVIAHRSIEEKTWNIQANAHTMFGVGFEKLRSRWFGLKQDTALMRDVGRILHGAKDIKNPAAQEIADAWVKTSDYLLRKFNEVGGDIKTRADWGLKQLHEKTLMAPKGMARPAARAAWVDHTLPLIDEDKMRAAIIAILEPENAAQPLSGRDMKEALGQIYDNIMSGDDGSLPGMQKAVKNRHMQARVLAFKDAASWEAYNNKFGRTDLFDVMTSHIDTMAREIAMMEQLGPNPEALFDKLRAEVATGGYGGKKLPFLSEQSSDETKLGNLDAVWMQLTGVNDVAVTGAIANVAGGTRSVLTSAILGGATLSSFADLGTAALTASYNRMGVVKTLKRMISSLGSSEEDRLFAHRLGIIIDAASGRMRAAHEASAVGLSSKLAEFTIRASGLQAWTEGNKMGFHMAILADMADALHLGFKDADAGHGGMLSRHGWQEADWEALRTVKTLDHKGAKFVALETILQSDLKPEMRDRLSELLTATSKGETLLAIPEPGVRTLALMRGRNAQRGTISGELRRSAGMFKSFAFEMATGHGSRMMYQETRKGRAQYFAGLIAATTVMGAASYQLKAISRGREPVPWDEPSSWAAFAMQGGGLGLLGDFAVSAGESDRFGRGFTMSQLGPVAGLVDDAIGLTAQAAKGLAAGEVLPNARAVKTLSRYVPGSSIWYSRLAAEQFITSSIQQAVDPVGARRSWKAQETFYRENFGQGMLVRPGALHR